MGLSLLSDMFQLDLGGFFIHIHDGFVEVVVVVVTAEDVDEMNDLDVGDIDRDAEVGIDNDDNDDDGCLKGGSPRERRGRGGIMFDEDDEVLS